MLTENREKGVPEVISAGHRIVDRRDDTAVTSVVATARCNSLPLPVELLFINNALPNDAFDMDAAIYRRSLSLQIHEAGYVIIQGKWQTS